MKTAGPGRLAAAVLSASVFAPAMSDQAWAQAPSPALGLAKGELIVDGKPLALKHAIAASLPDTFEETKEAFVVLLTPEPVAADALTGLSDADDVRGLAKVGLAVKYGVNGYHMTIRHPVLKDGELQQSMGGDLPLDARGPDRVSGTVKSFADGPEEIANHKVQFRISFNAPVKRRFPLEQPLVLSAGARKLPAGGGEAGKAYLAEKCRAIPADLKDPKVFEKWLAQQGMLPTEKDLAEMSQQKGKKVTREEALAEAHAMVEMMSALAPRECKVLGGSADGTLAVLQVEAVVMGSRSRAEAYMVNDGGKWSFKKQGAWKDAK